MDTSDEDVRLGARVEAASKRIKARHQHKVNRFKGMSADELRHEAAAVPAELVETLLQPETRANENVR